MNPYVIGISGASAQQLAERTLEWLMRRDRTVHVVMSRGAHEVWRAERSIAVPVDPKLQEQFWKDRFQIDTGTLICHRWDDQSAVVASGSVATSGMVVVPCSMGTVGRLAAGLAGDLLERWTNGRYRSTLHRVKPMTRGKDRFSIAFFVDPDSDTEIKVLESCIDTKTPRKFSDVNAGEYIRGKLENSHVDFQQEGPV